MLDLLRPYTAADAAAEVVDSADACDVELEGAVAPAAGLLLRTSYYLFASDYDARSPSARSSLAPCWPAASSPPPKNLVALCCSASAGRSGGYAFLAGPYAEGDCSCPCGTHDSWASSYDQPWFGSDAAETRQECQHIAREKKNMQQFLTHKLNMSRVKIFLTFTFFIYKYCSFYTYFLTQGLQFVINLWEKYFSLPPKLDTDDSRRTLAFTYPSAFQHWQMCQQQRQSLGV